MNATFPQHLSPHVPRSPRVSGPIASLALDPDGRALHLGKQQSVTLRDAVGWTVRSLSGTVWITQDWDSRDIVLESGQSFVIDRPGAALISAFDQARICVAQAPNRCATALQAAKPRAVSSFLPNSTAAA